MKGTSIGIFQGDTRSLDYGQFRVRFLLFRDILFRRLDFRVQGFGLQDLRVEGA